ncbi:MAG: NCS2 family permease [Phycisphaerae bacterium]|nr:NCS2 family permease [Phycisphaerae bacterium]
MTNGIESLFCLRQRESTIWREVLGGLTTFLALSYILFVQVAVLGSVGVPVGGIIFATCVASAAACFIMGFWANYPIALAPGMGENFYFAMIAGVMGAAAWGLEMPGWKPALALVMLVGAVFFLLSWTGIRRHVIDAMPPALRYGVAAGIGLLIATVGLDFGNLIQFGGPAPQPVPLGGNPAAWLTLIGLLVIFVLTALRVPGAVLVGIVVNGLLAMFAFGLIGRPGAVFSHEIFTGVGTTISGGFEGFAGLARAITGKHLAEVIVFAVVLLFMDVFDTIGTLVGVLGEAKLTPDGRLPDVRRALVADAVGTTLGGALGTSTVTSYVESAAGVAMGARTGLAAVVAGVLMLLALFFRPIIEVVGQGVQIAPGVFKQPLIAPALIFVGALMLRAIRRVDWDDVTEYVPAFLAALLMPLTMSISHGIAAGFIAYALGKLLTGRAKQCPAVVYVVAALFVARYVLSGWLLGA